MRRQAVLFAVSAALLFFCVFPVFAQDPVFAKELTEYCAITGLSGAEKTAVLLDRDPATVFSAGQGVSFTLTCQYPVSQLYFIWDTPAVRWEYTVIENGEEKTVPCGQNDFMHKYILLDSPQTEISVTFLAKENALCDIYAFSDGKTPETVQQWRTPADPADILLFPAHFGDEFFCFGGVVPFYTGERGLDVQLAYLTVPEETFRLHELLDGLWAAGVTSYPVMSELPEQYAASVDEARTLFGEEDFIRFQTEQIRRFKPSVVIGHSERGEYGDGVRGFSSETLMAALEAAANDMEFRASAKKYGVWDTPKAYLHLYPENQATVDWSAPLERFDGKSSLEAAGTALLAHASQLERFLAELGNPDNDCRFGLVRTTLLSGAGEGDFFSGIASAGHEANGSEAAKATDVAIINTDRMDDDPIAPAPVPLSVSPSQANFTPYLLGAAAVLCFAAAFLLRNARD